MARFSFGNAAMHFAQAEGPRGFIWKYLLSYLVATALMAGIVYLLLQPLFGLFFELIQEAARGRSEAEIETILSREIAQMVGRIVFSWLAILILGALFWAVFEAAIQRRYVREEGFSIGFGGDELRLLVVGLIWLVFMFVCYILTGILTGILMAFFLSSTDEPMVIGIAFPFLFALSGLFWAYFAVRLSPASAMTIRDRRIQFLGAWGATQKRFLPLFFAFVLLSVVLSFVFMIVYMIGAAALFATFFAMIGDVSRLEENPEQIFSLILNGGILYPFIGFYFVMLLVQGVLFYVWAGPAALAAKTDPRGGGTAQAPDAFI